MENFDLQLFADAAPPAAAPPAAAAPAGAEDGPETA